MVLTKCWSGPQLGTKSDATVYTGHQLIRENFTAALVRLLASVK